MVEFERAVPHRTYYINLESFEGVWSLFLANWENFNKLFLYGYLWLGFCGATASLAAIR